MLKLEENKTYTLYATEIVNGSGDDFIQAYDDQDKSYRIKKVMKWQYEELPRVIHCIAMTNKKGQLRLVQDLAYYYRKQYEEGETYEFTVKDLFNNDPTPYYIVEDETDSFFFPFKGEPRHQISDTLLLTVESIKDNGQVFFKEPSSPKPEKKSVLPLGVEATVELKIPATAPVLDIPCEGQQLERKTSIVYKGDGSLDVKKQTYNIIRVLASFMNTDGGKMYIGVHDKTNKLLGIESDYEHLNDNEEDYNVYPQNTDGYENLLRNRMAQLCQGVAQELVKFEFPVQDDITYCVISVEKSKRPIWVQGNQLWVRTGNSTRQKMYDDISFFLASYDIFNTGVHYTPEQLAEAMRQTLNRNFAKTDIAQAGSEVTYHITWYNDCTYQKTKELKTDADVVCSLPVYKNVRDGGGVVLFCYDNGHVNKVEIKTLMKGMNMDAKRNQRAYNENANLLRIFITLPSNILAVISNDEHGIQNVKAHEVTHINQTQGGSSKGSTFVPSPCTSLQYKLVDSADRSHIQDLIFAKAKTSSDKGHPVNSPTYKTQIEFLMKR